MNVAVGPLVMPDIVRTATSPEDPNVSRRGALIRILEIGAGVGAAVVLTSGEAEPVAEARRLPPVSVASQDSLVSIQVEALDGSDFPSFSHGADVWVAGSEGQRYNLRLQNHSPERVEVVVTVDGRDVISGQLGDYVKQRGYVLDPFDSLIIEGYRQSFDSVAAFRFAEIADSYSARLGTPVHVGLIGVAAFSERGRDRRRQQAVAPIEGHPFPGEDARAPAAEPATAAKGSNRAERSRGGDGESMSWAAPEEARQLGTEYGESTFSPVEEVTFKRKNRRKPDQLLVLHYDSMNGLRARGVVWDEPSREPIRTWDREPRPEPRHREFAPPPPPKDWWR